MKKLAFPTVIIFFIKSFKKTTNSGNLSSQVNSLETTPLDLIGCFSRRVKKINKTVKRQKN